MDQILKDLKIAEKYGETLRQKNVTLQSFIKIVNSTANTHQMREQIQKDCGFTMTQVLAICDRVKDELKKDSLLANTAQRQTSAQPQYSERIMSKQPAPQAPSFRGSNRIKQLLKQPPNLSGKLQPGLMSKVQQSSITSLFQSKIAEKPKVMPLQEEIKQSSDDIDSKLQIQITAEPLRSPSMNKNLFRDTTADSLDSGTLPSEDHSQVVTAQFQAAQQITSSSDKSTPIQPDFLMPEEQQEVIVLEKEESRILQVQEEAGPAIPIMVEIQEIVPEIVEKPLSQIDDDFEMNNESLEEQIQQDELINYEFIETIQEQQQISEPETYLEQEIILDPPMFQEPMAFEEDFILDNQAQQELQNNQEILSNEIIPEPFDEPMSSSTDSEVEQPHIETDSEDSLSSDLSEESLYSQNEPVLIIPEENDDSEDVSYIGRHHQISNKKDELIESQIVEEMEQEIHVQAEIDNVDSSFWDENYQQPLMEQEIFVSEVEEHHPIVEEQIPIVEVPEHISIPIEESPLISKPIQEKTFVDMGIQCEPYIEQPKSTGVEVNLQTEKKIFKNKKLQVCPEKIEKGRLLESPSSLATSPNIQQQHNSSPSGKIAMFNNGRAEEISHSVPSSAESKMEALKTVMYVPGFKVPSPPVQYHNQTAQVQSETFLQLSQGTNFNSQSIKSPSSQPAAAVKPILKKRHHHHGSEALESEKKRVRWDPEVISKHQAKLLQKQEEAKQRVLMRQAIHAQGVVAHNNTPQKRMTSFLEDEEDSFEEESVHQRKRELKYQSKTHTQPDVSPPPVRGGFEESTFLPKRSQSDDDEMTEEEQEYDDEEEVEEEQDEEQEDDDDSDRAAAKPRQKSRCHLMRDRWVSNMKTCLNNLKKQ